LIHGVEEYTAIIIISIEARSQTKDHSRLGVRLTVYQGRGGLRDTEQDILALRGDEVGNCRVKNVANEIGSGSFYGCSRACDAQGGVVRGMGLGLACRAFGFGLWLLAFAEIRSAKDQKSKTKTKDQRPKTKDQRPKTKEPKAYS